MLTLAHDPQHQHTSNKPSSWILAWQAPQDYAPGTMIEVRGNNLKTIISFEWFDFSCSVAADEIWRTPQKPTFNDISAHNMTHTIVRYRLQKSVAAGEAIELTLTARPESIAEATYPVHIAVNGQDVGEDRVVLTTFAGPPALLKLIARPALERDGSLRVVVQPADAYGYPTYYATPLPVQVTIDADVVWTGEISESTVFHVIPPIDRDVLRLQAHIQSSDLAQGSAITNGIREGASIIVTSNPVWLKGVAGLQAAFGEIHWHTNHSSDGMRLLSNAFVAARDLINLDFASPGDHTPKSPKWSDTVHQCDAYNADGVFTTIYSWEQSSDRGHVNFYFLDADHPMNPDNFDYPIRPADYIEDIPHHDFIAVPHHTNAVSKAIRDDGSHYWDAYPWGEPRHEYLRLMEIFQTRGNFEREDPPDGWRTIYRGHGGSAATALRKGHQIGFTGGTDNHTAWPAKCANDWAQDSWIYTGAWVTDRTRHDLYDALYARHTWACWDTRALVYFTINGAVQGDVLQVARGESLKAVVRMSIEAPLDVLELVTEDDRAVPIVATELDFEVEVDLEQVADTTFYYLRARQVDGALIYASPIFIEVL